MISDYAKFFNYARNLLQASESQIKGQLTAARTQLTTATNQQRLLNEQVAVRKVREDGWMD